MQGRNSTKTPKPKSGDGTQLEKPTRDANWYGPSQEPQEEFVENDAKPKYGHLNSNGLSEATPTFYGDGESKQKENDETLNRCDPDNT